MAVNDPISATDYNTLQTGVASVMGSGSGNYGYGQRMQSSPVSLGQPVTVNEWGNLRYDIINAYTHQNGSANNPALVSIGDTVRYNSAYPLTSYTNIVSSLQSNRFSIGSGQYKTVNKGTGTSTWPGLYGASWSSRVTCTVTCSWSTAAAARYFFNTGGQIQITSSRSGGSVTPQNTSWTSILNSAGTRAFGGNYPGTGTSPNDGTNWYRCTNNNQSYYALYASSPYGSNDYRLYASTPSVANNTSGTSNSVQILVEFLDGHTGVLNTSTGQYTPDYVDGTITVNVVTLEAVGNLQPSALGAFTVESPLVTISAIS
jgi:hypothetical protein